MGFSELEVIGQIASFERRLRGKAPTPLALPYPFCTSTWTWIDAERDKREVRCCFFSYFGRYTRLSYCWILAYICRASTNKLRDNIFQIGIISKFTSKILPDDAFFMAALKRLPYCTYYYCRVSLPFGSVGIVLCNQRRTCSEYESHPDHIWYSGACALETWWMVIIVVSVQEFYQL